VNIVYSTYVGLSLLIFWLCDQSRSANSHQRFYIRLIWD
jgi:hypothetical protein